MNSQLVKIESLSPLQRQQLEAIELLPEQRVLVGDVHGALHTLGARPAREIQGYVLLVDEVPRGLFVLKRGTLLPRWANGPAATFHALMIDRHYQGLGLGRYCMQQVPALVESVWPDIGCLMLAVEPANQLARGLYQSLGWVEDGRAERTQSGFELRMVYRLG